MSVWHAISFQDRRPLESRLCFYFDVGVYVVMSAVSCSHASHGCVSLRCHYWYSICACKRCPLTARSGHDYGCIGLLRGSRACRTHTGIVPETDGRIDEVAHVLCCGSFYAAFTRNLQPRRASPSNAEVDPHQRACVLMWGRPINGRTHNEKSTRMHRHAGLWHHPRGRLSACPVGNLSDGHLLAGIRPRRIQRNSASCDNRRSAVSFRNEASTVTRDGKIVVRARAILVAGSRAWRCGWRALESRATNPLRVRIAEKTSRGTAKITAAHLYAKRHPRPATGRFVSALGGHDGVKS
jgi:hypothetical protein